MNPHILFSVLIKKSGLQQPLSAKGCGKSSCHLHSPGIPFGEELDVAAAPAQEEENTGYKDL